MMETLQWLGTTSDTATRFMMTGAAADESLASSPVPTSWKSHEWNEWIDRLLHWRQHPEELGDENAMPTCLIEAAIQTVWRLRDTKDLPAPIAVVPNGDGGISIHFRDRSLEWSVEILSSFNVDFYVFDAGILRHSQRIV